MIDLRFATALQIVLSLAVGEEGGGRATSQILATATKSNPSFVRKLLVPLARNGIVVSTMGKSGGVRLARAHRDITLKDIYLAVVDDKRLLCGRSDVPCVCLVSSNMTALFGRVADDAQTAMLASLAARTVAGAIAELREMDANV